VTSRRLLVAGLGNPGGKYARTRHNIGFLWVDHLAAQAGVRRWKKRYHGLLAEATWRGWPLTLFKPQTFMNHSGRALQAALAGLRQPREAVWIAHDELDLPTGTLRLKRDGGPGGHNGLRSVIGAIGKAEYVRLRFGIGHPGNPRDVIHYVLSPFAARDRGGRTRSGRVSSVHLAADGPG